MPIRSYRDKTTEQLHLEGMAPGVGTAEAKAAHRKLLLLDAAESLGDLRSPPGNRLEALKGDRKGQHSIRVNDQFRICFFWNDGSPTMVEFVDYH